MRTYQCQCKDIVNHSAHRGHTCSNKAAYVVHTLYGFTKLCSYCVHVYKYRDAPFMLTTETARWKADYKNDRELFRKHIERAKEIRHGS